MNPIDSGNLRPTNHSDLLQQIEDATKLTQPRKKRRGNVNNDHERIIPSAVFEADNAGDDSCLRPSSDLNNIAVDESMGGGHIYCDSRTMKYLHSNINDLGDELKFKIRAIRIVENSIPTLKSSYNTYLMAMTVSMIPMKPFVTGPLLLLIYFLIYQNAKEIHRNEISYMIWSLQSPMILHIFLSHVLVTVQNGGAPT